MNKMHINHFIFIMESLFKTTAKSFTIVESALIENRGMRNEKMV